MKQILCVIFVAVTVISCTTTEAPKSQAVNDHFHVTVTQAIHPEFFSQIKKAPDYPLFQKILRELSAEIHVTILNHKLETYSSFSGFNGVAEEKLELEVRLGTSVETKIVQFRVDGEAVDRGALRKNLLARLAHKLVDELKATFVYLAGVSSADVASEGGAASSRPVSGIAHVFTVQAEQNVDKSDVAVQKTVKALQQLGHRVVQPEYLSRLAELNSFNLSAMTEESGNIMEFFDVEYLISISQDGGFYLCDIVSVSTAGVITSFSLSKAADQGQVVSQFQSELAKIDQ